MGNLFSLWKTEISDFSLDLISSITVAGQLSLRIQKVKSPGSGITFSFPSGPP